MASDLIASIIILPAAYSLTFGKNEFSDPSFALSQKFDFLDMVTKLYFGSYDTVRPEGLPFLYSGMLAFILMPLYFFAPHIRTREKIATGFLLLFFVISFNASTLDLVWHGFQRPNWLNYRQSFMVCFIIIVMAYKAYEALKEIGYRKAVISTGVIALLLLILQKMEYKNLPDFEAVWATLIFCAVYLGILRAVTWHDADTVHTASLVLAIAVSLEAFCGGFVHLTALDKDVVYSSRTSYRSFIDRVQPIVDEVKESDDSFYRMEKIVHRKTNDNLALGMRGLSNSTSTLNAQVIEFLKQAGLCSKSHWSRYGGSTPIMDSVFNIKYLIAETDDEVTSLYKEIINYEDDLLAYENPYVLSLAFGVNEAMAEFDFFDRHYTSPFERINHMVTEMLGEEKTQNLFYKIKTEDIQYKNTEMSMVVGHKKYTPSPADAVATITFTIASASDEMIYCFFPSDYPREVSVRVNGESAGTFFGNESFCIKQLGTFEPGEKIEVSLTLSEDDLYLATNEPFFYHMDEELYKKIIKRLSTSQYQIEKYTEDTFSGTIHVEEGQELIYTSIPYDAGWKVLVDGAEVETSEMMSTLLSFRVPAGDHKLELRYRPDCVKYGVILCTLGITAFAGIWVGESVYKRKKSKENAL